MKYSIILSIVIIQSCFLVSCKEKLYTVRIETFYKGTVKGGTNIPNMKRSIWNERFSVRMDSIPNNDIFDSVTVKIIEQ